jgi:hypothetical protein
MRPGRWGILGSVLLCLSGCATRYAYRFDLETPKELGDSAVSTNAQVDPTGARLITLQVTNKTSTPLQVDWAKITVIGPDARSRALRPDTDLGWVPPGETLTARLTPFPLPEFGDEALANDGAKFMLQIPMRPNGEPKVYRIAMAASVSEVKEKR